MFILPHREKFIRNNFIERLDALDEDLPLNFHLIKNLNSAEQFYLAQYYNWDSGVEVLHYIIDSHKCVLATASLIFWMADPDWYFKYDEHTVPKSEQATFQLLKKIANKFEHREFNKGYLGYDPTGRVLQVDWSSIPEHWSIPDSLKQKISGITPLSLTSIRNACWQWQRNRRLAKREVRKRNRNS